jgi:hypothetical protein
MQGSTTEGSGEVNIFNWQPKPGNGVVRELTWILANLDKLTPYENELLTECVTRRQLEQEINNG